MAVPIFTLYSSKRDFARTSRPASPSRRGRCDPARLVRSEDDPADVEDRYETRLRTMIEAKLKGEGIEPEAEEHRTAAMSST